MSIDFIPDQPAPQNQIDFIPDEQNQPQQSYLSSLFSKDQPGDLSLNYIASKLAPINAGAAKFGGNILQDVGSLAQNMGNSVNPGGIYTMGLGASNAAQDLKNIGSNVVNTANQTFGVQPSTTSNIEENIAQYAPYLAAAPRTIASQTLSRIPVIGNLLSGGLRGAQIGASYGASQSPQGQALPDALQNAEYGAIGGAAIPALGLGLKGIGSTVSGIKGLVGGNLQNASDNLYNVAAKNLNPSSDLPNEVLDPKQLNQFNTNAVMQNGRDQEALSSAAYKDFRQQVAQNNYAQSGSPAKSNFLGQTTAGSPGKFIVPTQDLTDKLNSLLENDPEKTQATNLSKSTKGAINNYLQSPIYDNAHKLQSALGKESANLKSFNPTTSNMNMSYMLDDARNSVQKNISNNFIANGDGHLATQLQALSDNFRDNVAPYRNIPSLWKAMNKNGKYPNIVNLLNQDGEDIASIRDHVLQNPEQSRTMLAQSIGAAAGKSGLNVAPKTGTITTNPNAIVPVLNNLQGHTRDYAQSSGMTPLINKVLTQYSRQQSIPKKIGWASAAVAYPAYHKLKEYL